MILLGDIHSSFNLISYYIRDGRLGNEKNIIQVGDFGIGFKLNDIQRLDNLNKDLSSAGITLWVMRGNHDNPEYFKVSLKDDMNDKYSNIRFVEDYEVHEIEDRNTLFIGGGISIDRGARTEGIDYWKDEKVIYDMDRIQGIKNIYNAIDILVTHSAPNFCFPMGVNAKIVNEWCEDDKTLRAELMEERNYLSDIFDELNEKFQFQYHFYGHFHNSYTEQIVNCKHTLLGIGEIKSI